MQELNNRTLAFLLNDKLDFTMFDLCRYIEEEYKSIDVYTIKKKFIQISNNFNNIINNLLSNFILHEIKKADDSIDDLDLISENMDVFFDITVDKSNDSITIERSSYN